MTTSHNNRLLKPFTAGIFTLIVIVFLSINFAVFWSINAKLRQSVSNDLIRRSQVTAETIAQFFAGKIQTVLILEHHKAIRDYMVEAQNSEEAKTNQHYPSVVNMIDTIENMYLAIDPIYDGREQTSGGAIIWLGNLPGNFLMTPRIIMDEHSRPHPWRTYERPWFAGVVAAEGGLSCTDVYTNIEFQVPCFTITKRIEEPDADGNNVFYGVVGLNVFVPTLTEIMKKAQTGDHCHTFLIDGNELVVHHPHDDFVDGRKLSDLGNGYDEVSRLIKDGRTGGKLLALDGTPTYVSFAKMTLFDINWTIVTVTSKKDAEAAVSKYSNALILIGIVDLIFFATPITILVLSAHRRSAELAKAKAMAEDANRSKSDFLSKMSHEIRTPMNAILGITEIQLRNDALVAETKEALGKIHSAGELLLNIINDILDLSKIEAGKMELNIAKCDMASLINDVVTLNMMRISSKLIEFKLSVDENIPATLWGDELRIKQILNNLLSNAFKYTEDGTVELLIYTETKKETDLVLVFEVNDTGWGMTEEQVSRLFEEYTRFTMKANRTTEGTGLGMNIARNLVRMMNGEIFVKSELDKGSTFIVRLPQENADSKSLGRELADNLENFRASSIRQMKKAQIVYEPMPYGRILVVDDVESNLYVAEGLLAPYGLSVDTATSGYAAIDKVKEGRIYDIIFMDHMMPGIDGIETTKIIRSMEYVHPIVALTANALAGQADMFLTSGFDDFVSKPIDIRHLNTVLKKFVRDQQASVVFSGTERQRAAQERAAKGATPSSASPQLIGFFLRDAHKAVATLETICEKQNAYDAAGVQTCTTTIHGMKSALAYIGEPELSALAGKLEQAGQNNDTVLLSSETPMFLDRLKALIERLTPQGEENSEAVSEDYVYLRGKLLSIKRACRHHDKKTAKSALDELRQTVWQPSIKELLAAIAEHLLGGDFEEVVNIADGIIELSRQ